MLFGIMKKKALANYRKAYELYNTFYCRLVLECLELNLTRMNISLDVSATKIMTNSISNIPQDIQEKIDTAIIAKENYEAARRFGEEAYSSQITLKCGLPNLRIDEAITTGFGVDTTKTAIESLFNKSGIPRLVERKDAPVNVALLLLYGIGDFFNDKDYDVVARAAAPVECCRRIRRLMWKTQIANALAVELSKTCEAVKQLRQEISALYCDYETLVDEYVRQYSFSDYLELPLHDKERIEGLIFTTYILAEMLNKKI